MVGRKKGNMERSMKKLGQEGSIDEWKKGRMVRWMNEDGRRRRKGKGTKLREI